MHQKVLCHIVEYRLRDCIPNLFRQPLVVCDEGHYPEWPLIGGARKGDREVPGFLSIT
jgi:hypothetical protein